MWLCGRTGDQKVNTKFYSNFIVIVDSGSISAASRKLFIAQPALSNQLKLLEKEFGAELVVRGARTLTLTEAGKIFYERAKTMLTLEEITRREITNSKTFQHRSLRIGLTTISDPDLAKILVEFNAAYPDITYEIFESSSDNLFHHLKNEIIEIAIVRSNLGLPIYPQFVTAITSKERLMLAYRKDSAFLPGDRTSISVSEMRDIPIALSYGVLPIVNYAFSHYNVTPRILSLSTSRITSIFWATAGRAAAILPVLDPSAYETPELYCRPFDTEMMSSLRCIGYHSGRTLSQAAQLFLDFCSEHLPDN